MSIMTIYDDETTDLTMTLIIGMKTPECLVVVTDGLASWDFKGLEHLGKHDSEDTEKVFPISPFVMAGLAGSKINWVNKLKTDFSKLARASLGSDADKIAVLIPDYIRELYREKMKDKDFVLAVFLAGLNPKTSKQSLYAVYTDGARAWPDDDSHPWLTIGNENQTADDYVAERYSGTLMTKEEAIKILKAAIKDSSSKIEGIGGHTFVYEISKEGTTRLE